MTKPGGALNRYVFRIWKVGVPPRRAGERSARAAGAGRIADPTHSAPAGSSRKRSLGEISGFGQFRVLYRRDSCGFLCLRLAS